jgi:broad specificity phosphatase PhoE
VWKRAGDFAHAAAAKTEETAIIVTHRVVLKAIVLAALGLGPEYFWSLRMDTCSISALDFQKGRMSLALLNDTCHLAGETDTGATDF